jgi:hypothetical protein
MHTSSKIKVKQLHFQVIPGGVMSVAYGAIAHKICQCMKERKKLLGSSFGDLNNECKKQEDTKNEEWLRRNRTERPVYRRR